MTQYAIHYEDDNATEVTVGVFASAQAAHDWMRKVLLPKTVGCEVKQGTGWMELLHPNGTRCQFIASPVQSPDGFMSNWNVGEILEHTPMELIKP